MDQTADPHPPQETLAARFADGAQPARQLLLWGAQIAESLAQTHAASAVHGDLRPATIALDTASPPVARVLAGDGATPDAPDALRYRPPEAWRGTHEAASDLYQLGLILHEGLRGAACFEGSAEALKRAHLQSAPPPLTGVDPSVSETIMRLLVKPPGARPQRAAEVAAILRVLANAGSTQVDAASGGEWSTTQSKAPPIIGKVWALTSLSLLLVLGGILVSSRLGTWDLPGSRVVEAPPVTFPQSTASGWTLPPAAAAYSAASAKTAAQGSANAPTPPPAAPGSARLVVDPPDATVRWGDLSCTASPCDVPTTTAIEARIERAGHESITVRLTPGAVEHVRLARTAGTPTP